MNLVKPAQTLMVTFLFPLSINVVSDDVAKFRVRGALMLKAGREPSVSLSQNQLSEEDRTKLKVKYDKQG